ncbi:MAG TPA: hypothetical protein VMS71_06145 [Candidatus Acidoferrum sp.]|nr:hypothetical protein [Candidatus Acidoferrum sp.]
MVDEVKDISVFERHALATLPPWAKLFVGLFVSLMLCVCFWATWMFWETRQVVDVDKLPAYLKPDTSEVSVRDLSKGVRSDLAEIMSDSAAVLAPNWDTQQAGREVPLDSAAIVRIARNAIRDSLDEIAGDADLEPAIMPEGRFRHNLGLAHTHVNGQTLLFFAIGFVFLFSSAKPKLKRILYWVFGVSVLCHAIGLTGRDYSWFFDDLLAVSGMAILGSIVYMAMIIYVDLGRKPVK